ncbi:cysteine hydrolase [Bradyrhizobium sp. LHD-71]|uniref:cysteine hydrolase family protein n=1 Tax=Bradyrhizobium sp. LHD-71 TaxID=3072141 RepID=UPI00280F0B26|nr:cysteine hydrolase [Bradyrhizobium sp. LHD-71]MDQ8729196.1 cysteine hydrolase [Bradyrhizobium sp. LHD-71]
MSSNAIYLVLDMENDLVHADGPNGKGPLGEQVRARNIIANTQRALDKARAAGLLVGYVRVGFSPDYRECPRTSQIFSHARQAGLFKLGTWGTEIHPDLKPGSGDFDIVKHRVSPFYGTSLEPILRAHAIEKIYVSGVSTVAVVQAAVREAHDRDYLVTIIEDGCCCPTAEQHAAAMLVLGRFADVTTSGDVKF